MKKIPTIFLRDLDSGSRAPGQVLNVWHSDCAWVREGEGVGTRKYDGTCCFVQDGRFYKRITLGLDDFHNRCPDGFMFVEFNPLGTAAIGWMPVTAGPDDKWHREAIKNGLPDNGTYELVGPKINGGKDGFTRHTLVRHSGAYEVDAPRTFEGLRVFLMHVQIEGVVWHHEDGRMAKIKRRDFGFKW